MAPSPHAESLRGLARRGLPVLALTLLLGAPAWAQRVDDCIVDDNGSGTITIPPAGCRFEQPQEVFMIIDGLPPGTTLELTGTLEAFFCSSPPGNGPCLVENGGLLGGQREVFEAIMVFEIRGTGDLSDYRRVLSLPLAIETQSAHRTPGDPVQAFDTMISSLQGSLPPGDPDFAQLQLTAGFDFGLNSFGHTTLTDRGDGTFHVERFFQVNYQITFQGAPGGALGGLAGTTTRETRIRSRGTGRDRRCVVPDDGSGTAALPPDGCAYLSPFEKLFLINGLPSPIELKPRLEPFTCALPGGGCSEPGGILGGRREVFDSILLLQLEGTGSLSSFRRTLRIPVSVETHSAPRTPGDPVQAFVTEVFAIDGTLTGDPDFASLTLTGGSSNGLPSPGVTILQDLGDGNYSVDSFYDLQYQFQFMGAPGGALNGLSGSTVGTVRIETLAGKAPAVEGGNGGGTVTLPPEVSEYRSSTESFLLTAGLAVGGTLTLDGKLGSFFCTGAPGCTESGGDLGGERAVFDATLDLNIEGNFAHAAFTRQIALPVTVELETAPRSPGAPVQRFDTALVNLQGSLTGDPDFAQLTLTAGSDNSLPSPGHTTLTDRGDGTFLVDSFFDIAYQIAFEGAAGGLLDGLSGTTDGALRLEACQREGAPAHNITIVTSLDPSGPTDIAFTGDLGAFSLDDDLDPALSNRRTFNNLPPGTYHVAQSASPDLFLWNLSCQDPDGATSFDLAAGEADIDLDLGEAITCTFSNFPADGVLFADGFESGNTSIWSSTQP